MIKFLDERDIAILVKKLRENLPWSTWNLLTLKEGITILRSALKHDCVIELPTFNH